jgi:hypothetical protein
VLEDEAPPVILELLGEAGELALQALLQLTLGEQNIGCWCACGQRRGEWKAAR